MFLFLISPSKGLVTPITVAPTRSLTRMRTIILRIKPALPLSKIPRLRLCRPIQPVKPTDADIRIFRFSHA